MLGLFQVNVGCRTKGVVKWEHIQLDCHTRTFYDKSAGGIFAVFRDHDLFISVVAVCDKAGLNRRHFTTKLVDR